MNQLLSCTKSFCNRNASTILTCIGGVGVVVTSVMAVKATPKALTLLEKAKEEKGEELTKLETVRVAGPVYIPSVITGVSTIACIFGANTLNKKKQAALMSAYALVDNSYKGYKAKVKELYGEEVNTEVVEEITKDEYEENDISVEDNKLLFFDNFSMRYFESTMEDVILAEYNLNRQIAINSGAYLNEFYDFLNIPQVDYGQELGWSQSILSSMYWAEWLDFDHHKVVMDDGLECYIITMRQEPVIDFAYY